jgi:uncharacterized phage protein (TIGR01671 family)
MKPFKFRVWCKYTNYFSSNDSMFFLTDDGQLYTESGHDNIPIKCDSERYEISYSTGLFDKNGKGIFCFDIIKVGACNYMVKYCEKTARFVLMNPANKVDYDFVGSENWNHMEIIYNKYENPELLERLK